MALPCRELTPEALLGELGDLFGRTGEVARRGQRSLEDGLITVDEVRSLRRSVEDLLREGVGTLGLLVQREGGGHACRI